MKIKMDTSNKKPTVYNIGVLTIVAVAAVLIIAFTSKLDFYASPDNQRPYTIIAAIMVTYFTLTFILLIHALKKQIEYNLYSYNSIYYAGFAIFVLSMLITSILLLVSFQVSPNSCSLLNVLSVILSSATTYMLFSFPFVLIFSIALCISNASLLRHEGVGLSNILGFILAILMIVGELFIFKINFYATGSMEEVRRHDIEVNMLAAIYLYFECMVIGVMIAGGIAARHEPDKDKDFAIVLGCGIKKDGTPTPLLKGRVDRAIEFYKKQKEETGKDLFFITSGGQGPDEVISESLSMKNYLISQGIPENLILEENQSTNTQENMAFSKKIIDEINPEGKAIFSTTNYHVFRSGLFARMAKLKAQGIGAKTKWYFWPNAAVREFVGLLTKHKVKQSLILGGMIVLYIFITYIYYN